jgi:RNA polymerase sigma factor (sigma-70 family)
MNQDNPEMTAMSREDSGEWLPTRASLLERLRQWSDNASWQEFFDTYWKLLFRTARAAGLDRPDAEEVVQETIICVARQLPDFRYRPGSEGGSFKEWLRNQTKWRIIDLYRRNRRHRQATDLSGTLSIAPEGDEPGPEAVEQLSSSVDSQWDEEWELTRIEAALQRLKRRVDARQYQVFYLLEMKPWKPREVARQLDLSLASVYTIRFRTRKLFRQILNELKEKD